MDPDTATIITFSPPLPCATVAGEEEYCGAPATAATLMAMGGGAYVMQPVCRACVAGMARAYGVAAGDGSDT